MYADSLQRRVQRPKSETTNPLTEYSENLEKKVFYKSRKLSFRTTGPSTIRPATEGTVIIEKKEFAIPIGLHPGTGMFRVPYRPEPLTGTPNNTSQPDSDRLRAE